MLTLGSVFSRLWKLEWKRRQRAMELRARVRLHALAMDMMKKPAVSPRVLQDPLLRRDLLLSLHQQSAMDIRYMKLLQRSMKTAPHRVANLLTEQQVSVAVCTFAQGAGGLVGFLGQELIAYPVLELFKTARGSSAV